MPDGARAAAGRQSADWWLVIALTAASALVLFDVTAFGVALPSLRAELGLGPAVAGWAVNAYIVAVTALTALGGRLADRLDRVRVFQAGAAVFALASLACGLTPDLPGLAAPWLIAFRALQGAGGAVMLPAAMAAVVAAVPADMRGRAISVFIGAGQVFFILGPVLGGLMTEQLSWRMIFLVALPLAAAAIAMTRARAASRSVRTEGGGGPLLRWTAIPLILGLALLVLGLERGADWGWLSPATLGTVALGLASLAVMVWREWGVADPLVQLHLLRRRDFAMQMPTLWLLQTVTIGILTFAPIYFERLMGLSPGTTGFVMLAFVGGWAGMVPVAGWLYDRIGPAWPKLAGAVLALAGLAWWGWSLPGMDLAVQLPAMLLSGIGVGLSLLPAGTAAISAAPADGHAATVGLIQTVRQSGGIFAVALLGGLFLAHGADSGTAVAAAQTGFAIMIAAAALNLPVALAGLRGR
ncbi:MFS transporter, partial [Marinibaculum pumilum]